MWLCSSLGTGGIKQFSKASPSLRLARSCPAHLLGKGRRTGVPERQGGVIMRKALLLASAIVLTTTALAVKPAEAATQSCGCWCCMSPYYTSYTCRLSNGSTSTCKTYCNLYCLL